MDILQYVFRYPNAAVDSTVQYNVIYCDTEPGLGLFGGVSLADEEGRFPIHDYNLYYYRVAGSPTGNGWNLATWQGWGNDANASTADPLIVNHTEGDYRLQRNSPAIDLGFDAPWLVHDRQRPAKLKRFTPKSPFSSQ